MSDSQPLEAPEAPDTMTSPASDPVSSDGDPVEAPAEENAAGPTEVSPAAVIEAFSAALMSVFRQHEQRLNDLASGQAALARAQAGLTGDTDPLLATTVRGLVARVDAIEGAFDSAAAATGPDTAPDPGVVGG